MIRGAPRRCTMCAMPTCMLICILHAAGRPRARSAEAPHRRCLVGQQAEVAPRQRSPHARALRWPTPPLGGAHRKHARAPSRGAHRQHTLGKEWRALAATHAQCTAQLLCCQPRQGSAGERTLVARASLHAIVVVVGGGGIGNDRHTRCECLAHAHYLRLHVAECMQAQGPTPLSTCSSGPPTIHGYLRSQPAAGKAHQCASTDSGSAKPCTSQLGTAMHARATLIGGAGGGGAIVGGAGFVRR